VALVLDPAAIPIDPALAAAGLSPSEALEMAVSGGEDYELCLCAEADAGDAVRGEFLAAFGVALTRVGWVEAGAGVYWGGAGEGRTPALRGGFQHFGGDA
jgi:thiamine-monophosphate kinase